MIGSILKSYKITEKIKDGSVGTIYKAFAPSGKIYAIKQITKSNAMLSKKLRAFEREASIASKLDHRYIIKVHEYIDVKPQPFFSMEYFESENLKYSLYHPHNRIHKNEFRILRQIAEALSYIHSLGIVHKDIKPENILVNKDYEIRLIDFSLAQAKLDRFLQFNKRIEGTPLYMSPEQIRGEKVDERSDIYSFGVLIFELLTKRPPFIGVSEQSIFEKHIKGPPPKMRTFVETISEGLEELIQKMLAKNPDNRFQDMTTILYELSKWERQDTEIRIKQVPNMNK